MTIEWRYTVERNLGVLSVAGFLGTDAVHRFSGAVDWALARGTGPVILDLAGLRAWSTEGRRAVTEAACCLEAHGRSLELAALPVGCPFAPDADRPHIAVHDDLSAALAAHAVGRSAASATARSGGVTAGPHGN